VEHLGEYLAVGWIIFSSVVALASLVASLTPNKRDDEIVAQVRAIANMLALNVFHAKPIPDDLRKPADKEPT
jgi:hypothetical protein